MSEAVRRGGVIILAVLCAAIVGGNSSVTEKSRDRGRSLVEASLRALGAGALAGATGLTVASQGIYSPSVEGQGWRPGERLELPETETLAFDFTRDRIATGLESRRNDGSLRRRRTVLEGAKEGRLADLGGGLELPLDMATARATRLGERRKVPQLLLEEALDRGATLRFAGGAELGGRAQETVLFTDASGAVLTLFLDRETALPTGYQRLMTSPLHGMTTAQVEFPAYRDVPGHPGLRMPTGRVERVTGEVVRDVRTTRIEVGDPAAEHFEIPSELRRVSPDWRGEALAVQWLDEGVGMVRNAGRLNVLFVELDDGVLLVDAPRNPRLTRQVIKKVNALVSEKPIRYAVLTHHHTDHSGGLAAFAAAGATIYTTPGNRKFVEAVAAAQPAAASDAPGADRPPLRVELVEGSRVLGRGERTVELIDIGPTPHVEEALVVYLPREKLIFQGDQFIRYSFQEVTSPRELEVNYGPTKRSFARWILSSGLGVERIVGSHNDEIMTPRHLEVFLKSVEARSANAAERDGSL